MSPRKASTPSLAGGGENNNNNHGGNRDNNGSSKNGGGGDDYFHGVGKGRMPAVESEFLVRRFEVVTGSENKRMNNLAWSPTCEVGHMILAA